MLRVAYCIPLWAPLAMSPTEQAHTLLHADETAALGDAGYQSVKKRPEMLAKRQLGMSPRAAPNSRRYLKKLGRMSEKLEHLEAGVDSKVEHLFYFINTCSVTVRRATAPWREHCTTVYIVWLCQFSWLVEDSGSLKPELRLERQKVQRTPLYRIKTGYSDL
jgi:hypothetical protein